MMVYTKDMIQKIIASLFFVVSLAFIFPAYASAAPITTTQEEEQNVPVQSDDEQKNTQSSLTNGQKLVNFMSTYFQPFVYKHKSFLYGWCGIHAFYGECFGEARHHLFYFHRA